MGKKSISLEEKMRRANETSGPDRMPCVATDGTVQKYSGELVALIDILNTSQVGLTFAEIQARLEAHPATRATRGWRRKDSPGHYIYQGRDHSGRQAAVKAGVVGPPIIEEIGLGASKKVRLTDAGRTYAKSAKFQEQLRKLTEAF